MIPYSGVAAFIVGAVLWWVLVARTGCWRLVRGLWVGALVGFISHPLAWYLALIGNFVAGTTSTLGEPTLDPIQGLFGALVFSIWSWLLTGWLTVPVGGIIGMLLVWQLGDPVVDNTRIH